MNHKRIERLLRVERLLVGQRRRRKRRGGRAGAGPGAHGLCARRPGQRPRLSHLGLVDDLTREGPLLLVDFSLPAERIVEALDTRRVVCGRPGAIACDHGPEFESLPLDQWAARQGIRLAFIRPGRPVENCYIESFNGKLRDECLDQHHFGSLAEAQAIIEAWPHDYNTARPHRGLGLRTPAEYPALFTPTEDDVNNTKTERTLTSPPKSRTGQNGRNG